MVSACFCTNSYFVLCIVYISFLRINHRSVFRCRVCAAGCALGHRAALVLLAAPGWRGVGDHQRIEVPEKMPKKGNRWAMNKTVRTVRIYKGDYTKKTAILGDYNSKPLWASHQSHHLNNQDDSIQWARRSSPVTASPRAKAAAAPKSLPQRSRLGMGEKEFRGPGVLQLPQTLEANHQRRCWHAITLHWLNMAAS